MRSRIKGSAPASREIEPDPAAPRQTVEKRQSVIGASLQFVGEIRSTGSVRIEGQVDGTIAAHTLTVTRSGEVSGRVIAEIARIEGRVEGDLQADTVELGPTARVLGDITYRSLAMEPGARFEGRSLPSTAKSVATVAQKSAAAPGAAQEKRALRSN